MGLKHSIEPKSTLRKLEKGYALVINNNEFPNAIKKKDGLYVKLEERKGSQIDVDYLNLALPILGCKTEKLLDKTKKELFNAIENIQKNFKPRSNEINPQEYDFLVVIVMTHGDTGGIVYAKDEFYELSKLIQNFQIIKHFEEKPKIFLIQACRGNDFDWSLATSAAKEFQPIKFSRLYDGNTFIAHSTIEHKRSIRRTTGTLFIQKLKTELEAILENSEITLEKIFTNVNMRVGLESKETKSENHYEGMIDSNFQTPVFETDMNYNICINMAVNVKLCERNFRSKKQVSVPNYNKIDSSSSENIRHHEKPLTTDKINLPVHEKCCNSVLVLFYEKKDEQLANQCEIKLAENENMKSFELLKFEINSKLLNIIKMVSEILHEARYSVVIVFLTTLYKRLNNNDYESDLFLEFDGDDSISLAQIIQRINVTSQHEVSKIVLLFGTNTSDIQDDCDPTSVHYQLGYNSNFLLFVAKGENTAITFFETMKFDDDIFNTLKQTMFLNKNETTDLKPIISSTQTFCFRFVNPILFETEHININTLKNKLYDLRLKYQDCDKKNKSCKSVKRKFSEENEIVSQEDTDVEQISKRSIISYQPFDAADNEVYNELQNAVLNSVKIDFVKSEIEAGANTSVKTKKGLNLLHLACMNLKCDMVSLLVNYCDMHGKDNMGWSPIHYAVTYNKPELVNLLLQRDANIIFDKTDKDNNVLHLACRNEKFDNVTFLLSLNVDTQMIINAKNQKGYTPLHVAAKLNKLDKIKILLETGNADISVITDMDYSVFHFASETGNYDTVKYLTNYKIDINAQTVLGCTPLHLAAKNNSPKVVEFLITKMNANTSLKTHEHENIMHYSSSNINYDTVSCLINLGMKNCINDTNSSGLTPLHIAAKYNASNKAARCLIDNGANTFAKTINGNSIIHMTCDSKNWGLLKYLLTLNKININDANDNGYTPLHLVAKFDEPKILALLIQNDANARAKTNEGNNVMHVAVNSDNFNVVKYLVSLNINMNEKNKYGLTPKMLAAKRKDNYKQDDIYKLLMATGDKFE